MITVLEGYDVEAKKTALEYFARLEEASDRVCHRNFDPEKLDEYMDCGMALDGQSTWYNCKKHASKTNRVFSYFVAQCRQRGVFLYVIADGLGLDTVDRRVRFSVDVRALCFDSADSTFIHLLSRVRDWTTDGTIIVPKEDDHG